MAKDDAGVAKRRPHRFVLLLLTPWWRLAWLIGGIAWCVILNVIYISGGASNEWIGAASVIPLFAFVVEGLIRERRLRNPQ